MMGKFRRLFTSVAIGALLAAGGTAEAAVPGEASTSAATAGCGQAPGLASGSHTISSGGQNRSYILRVPANYDNTHPYRLFVGLHWRGGTANDVDSGGTDGYNWSYYGLRRLADSAGNNTIFVAPQGNGNGWANPGGQDVTFIDDLLRQLEAALCVDTSQVFAGGFSYGGAMSYALACARPTVFRAVAVYSGANLSGCSGGTQPVAYIGMHGIGDNVLPIASGRSLRDQFVRNNGCTAQNPPEPVERQPDAHRHRLLRLPDRLPGGLGRVRRRPRPRPARRRAPAAAGRPGRPARCGSSSRSSTRPPRRPGRRCRSA